MSEPAGFALWRAGKLVPNRITTWLNLRGLYGPEVDIACGAQEPDVDQWEAGERYPTWDQTCRLLDLVGAPSVKALCRDPLPPAAAIVCWGGRRGCQEVLPEDQILTFRPDVVAGIRDDGGVDAVGLETLW